MITRLASGDPERDDGLYELVPIRTISIRSVGVMIRKTNSEGGTEPVSDRFGPVDRTQWKDMHIV